MLGTHSRLLAMFLIAAVFSAPSAQGEEVALNQWHVGANLGYGSMTNPLHGGDNLPLILIPDIAYYGESWYFDNAQLGYTFVEHSEHVLSVVTEFNPETRFFVDWHPSRVFALQGNSFASMEMDGPRVVDIHDVRKRQWALDVGLEYHYFSSAGQVTVNALADTTSVYNGWRADISWRNSYRMQRWIVEPTVGIKYANAEMNTYFYGLQQQEVTGLDALSLGSTLQPYANIDVSFILNKRNALRFHVGYIDYHSLASDSPLFEESSAVTAFIGLKHVF